MKDRAPVKTGRWLRWLIWALTSLILSAALYYGIGAISVIDRLPLRLVVYAFSTQEEVFTQSIFPSFEMLWEGETDQELTIESVFGPSGTLAGQINLGAPADIAVFSNAEHVTWLKFGRLVDQEAQLVEIGVTPLVIVTQPGNPDDLLAFSDLTYPGLDLLHADPRSSGAGEWAVLAEYGSALLESGDLLVAEDQLWKIWHNVRLLATSARAAMTLFELGAGDALVTYEQDALLASARGVPLEIVLPLRTILAQPVAVLVNKNVTKRERAVAEAFIGYLASAAGQEAFLSYYLRPVGATALTPVEGAHFPPLIRPFTVAELGGWSQAYSDLMETLWEKEIQPRLDLEALPMLLKPGEQE